METIKMYLAAYAEQSQKVKRCKELISSYQDDIKQATEKMSLVRRYFVQEKTKYKDEDGFKVIPKTRKAFVVNHALVPETMTMTVTFTIQNAAYLQQLIEQGIIDPSDVLQEIKPLTTKECQKLYDDGLLGAEVGRYEDVSEVAITLPKF